MGRNRGGYRGGNKRGRTQRRDFKDGRPNVWKKTGSEERAPGGDAAESSDRPGWESFVMESSAFEFYYKKQNIVSDDEWNDFIDILKKPLPSSFRINGSGQFAQNIRDQMQNQFVDLLKEGIEVDGEVIQPMKPLTWYPDNLAWVVQASRSQLRKIPILERIHEFLKQENEIGSITRQEAVSMIPPLLLDVQSHHRVLDMCAAPGSKTFQLLEMIHKEDKPGLLPAGMVIANDLDVQRCHLLIHQTKRMCSPNILVTNHEAQHLPGLRGKGRESKLHLHSSGKEVADEENGLVFDRILCDVPCSGDGTLRKAPDIWKKWHSGLGNGVHSLQIQIAMRGVALLKVGGRLVYSTCSLNPIEDEAVVGEILRQSEGSMELLDVSSEIPGLKFRPGLKSWKVRDKRKWLCSSSEVDRRRAGAVVPSMFPSGKGWDTSSNPESNASKASVDSENRGDADVDVGDQEEHEVPEVGEAEVTTLPLERCMRILPQDQNTGGFFIAVFRKVSTFKVPQKTTGKREKALDCHPRREKTMSTTTTTQSSSAILVVDQVDAGEAIGMVDETQETSIELGPLHLSVARETLVGENVTAREAEDCSNGQGNGLLNECPASNETAVVPTQVPQLPSKGRPQRQGRWKGVDPVLFLEDEEVFESLINYYGIRDTFPLRGHLITRSEDASRLKRIYYVSNSVREVIDLNSKLGGPLKITSAGLKIFERQTPKDIGSPCAFRIASEGVSILLPHMTKQIMYITNKDFKLLLSSNAVPFDAFNEPEFSAALRDVLPGCCVIILPKRDEDGKLDVVSSTAVGCWRGRNNVSLLITKVEALQFIERLFPSEGDLEPGMMMDAGAQQALDVDSHGNALLSESGNSDALDSHQDGQSLHPEE